MKDRHTFTATDRHGTTWFAVHEPLLGGWVALTRGSILHRRCAGDLVSADRATALLPVVQHHLPKLQWLIVRFR